LKNPLATKKNSKPLYQVLLLHNQNDDVTVQEAKKVNYTAVKEHLNKGGSVFITSKQSQKTLAQKKPHPNYASQKRNYGVLLKAHLRASKTV
jgi:hypothetical protein